MATGVITATATSTGTGTTRTRLNGDADLTLPEITQEIVSCIPYIIPSAALTAAETVESQYEVTSNDVTLTPKLIGVVGPAGGTGTFEAANAPVLREYPFHTMTGGGVDIGPYGTALTANTAAMLCGMSFVISSGSTGMPEQFWTNPGAVTATGTAAATVTGSSYAFNNSARISSFYGWIAQATVNLSDSAGGRIILTSNDFETSVPLDCALQGSANALGTAENVIIGPQFVANVNVPTRKNVTVTEACAIEQALAGNGTFMSGLSYQKV